MELAFATLFMQQHLGRFFFWFGSKIQFKKKSTIKITIKQQYEMAQAFWGWNSYWLELQLLGTNIMLMIITSEWYENIII